MAEGLTAQDWKVYQDLLTKANILQFEPMAKMMMEESQRRLKQAKP